MARPLPVLLAVLFVGACQQDDPSPGDAEAVSGAASAPAAGGAATPVGEAPVAAPGVLNAIRRAVDHPDRPGDDRDRDAQRRPVEILALTGIAPGMDVLDVFTAGGYYTEILSRLVGPGGEVWAQNPPQFYERFGSADLDYRLADRRLPNVERQDRPMDDLALPEARFDAAIAALVVHDFYWLTDDVPGVLAQIHRSLKPGGVLLVTDHSAPSGTREAFAREPGSKHRIDEAFVTELLTAAGFELVLTSDLLRAPEDDRQHAFFEPAMRGRPTDRFVHVYRKPG